MVNQSYIEFIERKSVVVPSVGMAKPAPLQLTPIRRCLDLWTNPGDIVLSPFSGIGSAGYVALEMGRKFIGAELKASYFRQACENLRTAESSKESKSLLSMMTA